MRLSGPCDNNKERSSPACHYCHQAALQESTLLQSQPASQPARQLLGQFVIVPQSAALTFTEVLVSLFGCRTVINDETLQQCGPPSHHHPTSCHGNLWVISSPIYWVIFHQTPWPCPGYCRYCKLTPGHTL